MPAVLPVKAMSNTEAMQRALTDVVSRGDFTVPPYPAVALRLSRLLSREGYGVGEVADVIAADAALAATVLAAANSALLGASTPITSLSRAVNRVQLFSPTRETREQWRVLYDAP